MSNSGNLHQGPHVLRREDRMPILEDVKRIAEKLTGIGRPPKGKLDWFVRLTPPKLYRFGDDGRIPNNAQLPLVVYRNAVRLDRGYVPAAVLEDTFAHHGWRDSWRDGIYPFQHFHTATHEVLGIARGRVTVRFGGEKGRSLTLTAGDVVVLPAGTGHRRIRASADLLMVGAYPAGGNYDEPRPHEVEHAEAVASIAKVRRPNKDPVYGADGPVVALWKRRRGEKSG
jgi:uncharacterized protein YjlB